VNTFLVSFPFDTIHLPVTKLLSGIDVFWPQIDTNSVRDTSLVFVSPKPVSSLLVLPDQILVKTFLLAFFAVNITVDGFMTNDGDVIIVPLQSSRYFLRTPTIPQFVVDMTVESGTLERVCLPALSIPLLTLCLSRDGGVNTAKTVSFYFITDA